MSDISTFLHATVQLGRAGAGSTGGDRNGFYAIERFLAGEKSLHAIENGELGAVAGKRIIHLQCHFGLDTLIWRATARSATGLDFSPAAIAEARLLAEATASLPNFVCANVYAAREAVAGYFDIAYVSWGTICWLPDLWHGRDHRERCSNRRFPIRRRASEQLILEERDGRLVMNMRSTTPADRPLLFDEPQTYSGDPTPLTAARTYHESTRCRGWSTR